MILNVAASNEQLVVAPERLVVAGYTGRDEAAVAAHIAELEAIGVPPPPSVPAFYDLDPALLTTDAVIEVGGPATSGEVEPVLVRHRGRYFLGVGSDHTDRDLERADIAASKAACPKPVGATVVEIGAGMATLDWDRLTAVSSVDGRTYQRGSVATLRHPADLLERMTAALGEVTGDLVLFCGTMPLLGGEFVHGDHWRIHLELPAGTVLAHTYETKRRSL
ncbi:DUF2848 family protein [Streptosporangium saharense]|uniref:DUF2848 family protein n=1 Tax=Streptosporangium saharense TaxID=1706840 RepID=UPI0036B988CF